LTPQQKPGCLTALLEWLGLAPQPELEPEEKEISFPYHLRDDFLSPAEISFYHVLTTIVGDGAVVCPKVSLGDLFYAATGDYGRNRSWMNRVDRKHVDFLLCDPGSMHPVLAVELDDATHDRPDRQERDAFVDDVFLAANLPLARVPAQAQYNTEDVRAALRRAVGEAETAASGPEPEFEAAPQDEPAPPPCPTCGTTMVLREVKRESPRQGEQFWGCPNFPKCRGTRDLDE
jgi:hypothetical protein